MQLNSDLNQINILYYGESDLAEIKNVPAKRVFDDEVCLFLNDLSVAIRKDMESKVFPDIITFGFFCRKANIEKLKRMYNSSVRIGKGLSFHIAPSNVPINFAYTLVAGLLSGNTCIVRASSKNFQQTKIICRLIEQVIKEKKYEIGNRIAVIQYDRNKDINDFLSSIADIRIIWGGDKTISEIRKSEINSRCTELTFADRYSIGVFDAKEVLRIDDWKKVSQDFYNDTYLYDQNACSSPRMIYWLGKEDDIENAKRMFWDNIHKYISPQYSIEPIIAVDKLTASCKVAIELDGVVFENHEDNLFNRIKLSKLPVDVSCYSCPGGSFLEYQSDRLDELGKIITKKFQTISYIGDLGKRISDWIISEGLSGVDRIVPVGKTADFTLTWDGYNLIEAMSRVVYYE